MVRVCHSYKPETSATTDSIGTKSPNIQEKARKCATAAVEDDKQPCSPLGIEVDTNIIAGSDVPYSPAYERRRRSSSDSSSGLLGTRELPEPEPESEPGDTEAAATSIEGVTLTEAVV